MFRIILVKKMFLIISVVIIGFGINSVQSTNHRPFFEHQSRQFRSSEPNQQQQRQKQQQQEFQQQQHPLVKNMSDVDYGNYYYEYVEFCFQFILNSEL